VTECSGSGVRVTLDRRSDRRVVVLVFGQDGCYLLVTAPDMQSAWVRRAPIVENLHVHVDDEGVLRTDHELRLGRIPVIRCHYRLQRRAGG
jgi:hypothetical protein